jgi:hypothetical protein
MNYSKTGVPWQINSILIIYPKLLEKLDFPAFLSILHLLVFVAILAYSGISWHIFPCKNGKLLICDRNN